MDSNDRNLRHAQHQQQHWQEISGIVFDVAALLEDLGRINSRQLCAYDTEQLSPEGFGNARRWLQATRSSPLFPHF